MRMLSLLRVSLLLLFLGQTFSVHAQTIPMLHLQLGNGTLDTEVAATKSQRARGLMHRNHMPDGQGMLFVYPMPAYFCMWMKNTNIPLSVAFIDAQGKVINIEDMTPYTETNHCTARNAVYALEVNRGWFARQGVVPGTQVLGLEKAPSGEY